jgi:hypothetical protein
VTTSPHGFPPLAPILEEAHRHAVRAATAGLQDAGPAHLRLTGPGVPALAEAAVSSATPFLRCPLLAPMTSVLPLHPPGGHGGGRCSTCRTPAPCATSRAAQW